MLEEVKIYFNQLNEWQDELMELRSYAIEAGLVETYKWKHPCYTYDGKNVLIIGEFKSYCSLTFFKGVLLQNDFGLLEIVSENVQADRIFKAKDLNYIRDNKSKLLKLINEAIEIEKAGLKVPMKQTSEYEICPELLEFFERDNNFKEAFYQLTPGRQRGYLLHFNSAKQSKTRTARILKYYDRIFTGKGFHDCVCGLSKRMPRCDGSHSKIK